MKPHHKHKELRTWGTHWLANCHCSPTAIVYGWASLCQGGAGSSLVGGVGERVSQRRWHLSWLAKTVGVLGGREEGRKAFQSSRTACAKSQRRERTELVPNGQDWIWLDGRVWGWSSRGRKQSRDSLLCRLAWLFISVLGCGSAKPVMRYR